MAGLLQNTLTADAVFLLKGGLMVLATIQTLCMICHRLLLISQTMLTELKRIGCNQRAIESWERELNHLHDLLRKMED